jgi:HK97 family phage major capsid protein
MAYDPKGKSSKQLHEDRAKIHTEARAYHDENESAWTKECEEKFSTMLADVSLIKATLDRRDSLAMLEDKREKAKQNPDDPMVSPSRKTPDNKAQVSVRFAGRDGKPEYKFVDAGPRGSAEYCGAFEAYLKGGTRALSTEQFAALQSDSPTQAGYLLASEQMAAGILKEVDDLVFIRRYAKIHTVMEASSLGIRKRTAKMNTFDWSAELSVSTEDSTLAYGKKVLTPHHLTGLIKLSRDLVRRSMGGAVSEVQYEMARDSSEKMEDGYLLGNGAQRPLGVFVASNDGIGTGRDVNTGSATAILADGLVDAKYKLKASYRDTARWLFHRDAIKMIAKLKSNDNQYIWQPGLQAGQPDRLLNLPVDESEKVPNTFTNGLYVGLLANWQFYEIADALEMEMQVVDQLYAATNQIGYIGRLKTDGLPTLEEAFARIKCST